MKIDSPTDRLTVMCYEAGTGTSSGFQVLNTQYFKCKFNTIYVVILVEISSYVHFLLLISLLFIS